MQKYQHILLSLLVVILWVIQIINVGLPKENRLEIIIVLCVALLVINIFIGLINLIADKIMDWHDKRRQKKYSLLTWIGDTNVNLKLYKELDEIKNFNHDNFHENYHLVKSKIKEHFPTKDNLLAFRLYIETRNGSTKFSALFSSTQTILIAIIIPAVLTAVNFASISSTQHLISIIVFLVFWILLLKAIDFMGKEFDKTKVMLRLINECIDDFDN